MLYVKKEKIKSLWPIFAEVAKKEEDDILRLNHTGTRPVYTDLGILNAMTYFEMIGAKRKEERLRFIQRYWSDKVRGLPKIVVNTPTDPQRSCAIANVGVERIEPKQLAIHLMKHYKIWTVAIDRPGVKGCRITPNIFTTTRECDQLVAALKEISAQ